MRLLCYSKLFAVVSIQNSLTSPLFIKRDRSIDRSLYFHFPVSLSFLYICTSVSLLHLPQISFHIASLLHSHTHILFTHTHTHSHTHHINLSFCLPNCLSLSESFSLSCCLALFVCFTFSLPLLLASFCVCVCLLHIYRARNLAGTSQKKG